MSEHKITDYGDGDVEEEWLIQGDLWHRVDGPAYRLLRDGQPKIEDWWQNGDRHRDDGPAFIEYRAGVPIVQSWWQYGKCHREDGPAIIDTCTSWCLDGRFVKEINVRRPKKYAMALRALPIPVRDEIWKHFSTFFLPKN